MRHHILTTIALLPLLFSLSQAAQTGPAISSFGFPSEDSGPSSYLGVDIADISADRLGALKLKEEAGVEVTMVDQDAPAGKAGIKEHDVILSLNGTAVESKTQLQRMIHETPPGRVITLVLSRDGQPVTIKVQLGDRRSEFGHMKDGDWDKSFHVEIPPIPPIPPIPNLDFEVPTISVVVAQSSTRSGLMVENLTPQLRDFFGARNGNGVLVRSVEKGSRADKAGLRAGDVITRVGDQPVHDTSDFSHALHSRSAGSVSVGLIRDKKEQTITLTLPERKESGAVIEESFDVPALDAETRTELSEARNEIAKLQPQMELAREEASKAYAESQKVYAEGGKAYAEMRKSGCGQQKQMSEQAEKLRQQLGPKVQQEIQKSRQKMQQEMQQLRRQLRSDGLDI
jgi:membrane-associated protease RseP (regulator of RpoE activity)